METKAEQFLAENWPSINRGLLEKAIDKEFQDINKKIDFLRKLQKSDFTKDEKKYRQYHNTESSVKRRLNFLSIVQSTMKVLTITAYEMLCFEVQDWYYYQDLQGEVIQLRTQNDDLKQRLFFRERECERWEKMYMELKKEVNYEVNTR